MEIKFPGRDSAAGVADGVDDAAGLNEAGPGGGGAGEFAYAAGVQEVEFAGNRREGAGVALKRADWANPPSPEYPGSWRPRVNVPLAFTKVLPNQTLGVLSTASDGMKVLRCRGFAALP